MPQFRRLIEILGPRPTKWWKEGCDHLGVPRHYTAGSWGCSPVVMASSAGWSMSAMDSSER